MKSRNSNIILKIIVPLTLALLFFFVAAFSIKDKTDTTDERSHMIRGIMLLKTGDYRLNQHHPILSNVIHAIPAVLNPNLKTEDTESENWKYAMKDTMASNLRGSNGGVMEFFKDILYYSRLVNIFLSALFIFVFYQIILKLFGPVAAIVSTLFLAINPTFIAHSSLVTTDTPVTLLIFLAAIPAMLFIRHYDNKKLRNTYLTLFIIFSFLSLITKYTAIVPFFVTIIILLIYSFIKERNFKQPLIILIITLLSIFFLSFAAYGFNTKTFKEAAYGNISKIEDDYKHINKLPVEPINWKGFVKNTYENVKLPMPQYIRGFYENVLKHDYYGHRSFFMGDFSKKGRIAYFPTAFAIKEPLPLVFLTAFSLIFGTAYLVKKKKLKPEYIVLIAIPVALTAVSLKSSLNLGIRHIIPIYPFIFLLIGITVNHFYNKKKVLTLAITIPLILFMYFSVLCAFPHYIEYFNESIGSKQNAYKYLRDSNLDWRQNNYLVEKYKLENPGEHYEIFRVESLFDNPSLITPYMQEMQDKYHRGELQILDYISNTHWVIKK